MARALRTRNSGIQNSRSRSLVHAGWLTELHTDEVRDDGATTAQGFRPGRTQPLALPPKRADGGLHCGAVIPLNRTFGSAILLLHEMLGDCAIARELRPGPWRRATFRRGCELVPAKSRGHRRAL